MFCSGNNRARRGAAAAGCFLDIHVGDHNGRPGSGHDGHDDYCTGALCDAVPRPITGKVVSVEQDRE